MCNSYNSHIASPIPSGKLIRKISFLILFLLLLCIYFFSYSDVLLTSKNVKSKYIVNDLLLKIGILFFLLNKCLPPKDAILVKLELHPHVLI